MKHLVSVSSAWNWSIKLMLIVLSKAGKINDKFRFAYCGMNHSNTWDPILFLVYSSSFNHHHHSYFIIMSFLSNERIISCMGLFFCSGSSLLDHFQHCLPTIVTFLLFSQWNVSFYMETLWQVLKSAMINSHLHIVV